MKYVEEHLKDQYVGHLAVISECGSFKMKTQVIIWGGGGGVEVHKHDSLHSTPLSAVLLFSFFLNMCFGIRLRIGLYYHTVLSTAVLPIVLEYTLALQF